MFEHGFGRRKDPVHKGTSRGTLISALSRLQAVTQKFDEALRLAEAGAFRWRRRQSGGDDFLRQKRDA
ncbi:MAG: hypothetical protein E5X80_28085 [Mesorhizobium sp.]|uniref:hypothetical protein n=1 Tax=Mesorhizobium sp. TaxID=1871066 RepID=UPI000FE8DC36|nr:hypothetical protein [Mesorhizobium sp.]RWM02535.1 MAG: hypothetical protein EOR71_28010 [Mesorhizobium sp.]TIO48456.1 MAG: hypothetical protein E5X78_29270 [Mesorhizobium sp.]TIO56792.1 MAG: hypothetical protein E5X79_29055 [Mesorhizobium sp.]TJV58439.1 MAG: hypothetical protein E5X80_28085 [Mesorhizobium sp.]